MHGCFFFLLYIHCILVFILLFFWSVCVSIVYCILPVCTHFCHVKHFRGMFVGEKHCKLIQYLLIDIYLLLTDTFFHFIEIEKKKKLLKDLAKNW